MLFLSYKRHLSDVPRGLVRGHRREGAVRSQGGMTSRMIKQMKNWIRDMFCMVDRGLLHDIETPCPCTTIALEYVQSCSSPGRITSPHSDIVCQGYIALVDVVLPLRHNARRPQYSRALATVCQPPISGRTPSNCHAEPSYHNPHGGLVRMGNGPRRIRGPLYGYVTIISPAEHNAALLVYSTYHFKIVSPQLCTASDALCVDLSPNSLDLS